MSSLPGWKGLDARTAWLEEIVLLRDPHAPAEPSARLALLAWNEGKDRDELREAARASRAIARVVSRGGTTLPALVDREGRAVSVLAPPARREERLEARLRAGGATAVRRLGERGLILALAPRDKHDALLAAARDTNLQQIDARPATGGVTVEEIST